AAARACHRHAPALRDALPPRSQGHRARRDRAGHGLRGTQRGRRDRGRSRAGALDRYTALTRGTGVVPRRAARPRGSGARNHAAGQQQSPNPRSGRGADDSRSGLVWRRQAHTGVGSGVIVDVHTHTPSHRERVPADERIVNASWRPDRDVVASNSWSDYDVACAAAEMTIAFNIAVDDPVTNTGIPSDRTCINESTAEFAAAAPDRRIGFMSVDPHQSDCLDEVERCRFELGLVGIKLAPNYQRFDPLGDAARRLFGLASKLELPIMIHQGASPIREAELRYAHPLLMDELAIAFPELRM